MALLRAPFSLRPGTPGMLVPSRFSINLSAAIASPPLPPTAAVASAPSCLRAYASQATIDRPDFYQAAHAQGIPPSQFKRVITREKDVLLSGLPTTATPADIRALARESKTANDVARIEFIYTKALRPSGKALISLSSHVRARAFEADAHGRIVGGRMINADLRSTDQRKSFFLAAYGNWPASYQIPFDLIEYEAGKLVLLRNIPKDTFEARLEERLANRYDLKPQDRWRARRTSYAGYLHDRKGYGGSHEAVLGGVLKLPKLHVDATTTNFIVRCQTHSEATRLVRRWHNTYFAPATFDIQDTGGRYRVSASILY
ncbi:uncharacterized protein UMAG_11552 [Mycosarcoma maydis]|uniref:RRM domain-containing protein n=1 Tax=Mycosarcoma maydis TaxID=5270 RepID=A0A0D1DS33_MYCMD|nr:uncharacterized protein UMAG_11552 [Ustilago maydis 521]KIS67084.1 hypothetical protein UMAG_11552 [Ustilago maydis 521]|eukprot:XP_011391366.1 hypothetical protein UMAG_11552 [Ustilago maydis 521]